MSQSLASTFFSSDLKVALDRARKTVWGWACDKQVEVEVACFGDLRALLVVVCGVVARFDASRHPTLKPSMCEGLNCVNTPFLVELRPCSSLRRSTLQPHYV